MSGAQEQLQGPPAVVLVALDRIRQDRRLQVRIGKDGDGTRFGTVRSYESALRAGQELPPITLARVDDVLYLADGWHRMEAHRRFHAGSIRATIVDAKTLEAAGWIAARGNLTHGLRLTRRDELEVFKRYVRAGQHRDKRGFKSYREMAEELCGIRGHTTIRNWMRSTFPGVYRAIGERAVAFEKSTEGLTMRAHQSRLKAAAAHHLQEVRNVLPGIRDAEVRGELVAEAEAILEEIREGGKWTPPALTPQDHEPF